MIDRAGPTDGDPGEPLRDDPMPLVEMWLREARERSGLPNPDAMSVATVDADGEPSLRIVLCRGFDRDRARFEFFTHYDSPKGRALLAHPRAAATFHWDPLGRQLRIAGRVEKTSAARSDEYFAGRHPLSQLGAWASDQSAPIASRAELERRLDAVRERFGDGRDRPIPRPPDWGGFALLADRIELWSAREGRLHDRARYDLAPPSDPAAPLRWRVARLQP